MATKTTWPVLDKSTWIEQVNQSISGQRSFNELVHVIEPGIEMDPFYMEHEMGSRPTMTNHRSHNHWKLIAPIDVSKINDYRLHKGTLDAFDGYLLLDGALSNDLEWVADHLGQRPMDLEIGALDQLPNNPHKNLHAIHLPTYDTNIRKALLQWQKEMDLAPDLVVQVQAVSCKTPSRQLTQILLDLNDWFSLIDQPPQQPIGIRWVMGLDYLLEIAKLSALHVLLCNLWKAYQLGDHIPMPIITAIVRPDPSPQDPHHVLIRHTVRAMAAISGGIDRLCIDPPNVPANQELLFREATNKVQHILRLESELQQVTNPFHGSYYIDTLAKKLAEKAWSNLQEKDSIRRKGDDV